MQEHRKDWKKPEALIDSKCAKQSWSQRWIDRNKRSGGCSVKHNVLPHVVNWNTCSPPLIKDDFVGDIGSASSEGETNRFRARRFRKPIVDVSAACAPSRCTVAPRLWHDKSKQKWKIKKKQKGKWITGKNEGRRRNKRATRIFGAYRLVLSVQQSAICKNSCYRFENF